MYLLYTPKIDSSGRQNGAHIAKPERATNPKLLWVVFVLIRFAAVIFGSRVLWLFVVFLCDLLRDDDGLFKLYCLVCTLSLVPEIGTQNDPQIDKKSKEKSINFLMPQGLGF